MANTSQTGAGTTDARLLSYEDFHPLAELSEDKDNFILTLHLPEFTKEQLRLTRVRGSYKIRIKGERQIAINKRRRFNQIYTIPQNCNLDKIEAKLQNTVLTITMPKEDVKLQRVPLAAKEEANMRQEAAHPAVACFPTITMPKEDVGLPSVPLEAKGGANMRQAAVPPTVACSCDKMDFVRKVDDGQLSYQKPQNMETGAQKDQDGASPQPPQVASTSNNALDKLAVEETKSQAEEVDQSVKESTKKETISKELSMTLSVKEGISKEGTVRKGEDETSGKLPQVVQSVVSQSGSPEKEKNNKVVDKEKICGDESMKEMKRIKDAAMKAVKGLLIKTEEERQINKVGVGVAALVVVGIGVYVALKIRSKARSN
ncbi:inactive protein RESTRICTED TEV MOVEMENT 2-like isoform X2 [Mangifera indica]|uniref:inactive protein RESTRICTED TEV MOVEMENT 2-like isoform X2 n=1 Tax=Mangifera indica TaxID=29780 RepID=UPI001CFB5BB6|nr:inactive protein RESTRICTED TEV MOVEMENT 2-like isoform X2 [Mangifera indica]